MDEINFSKKEKLDLPEGAVVTDKVRDLRVEEIENGFLVHKSFRITYTIDGHDDTAYYTKKIFTKENPLSVDEDKMLAENFK